MNIGEASAASGLPSRTIRYCEDIVLVRTRRAASGYRDYGDDHERLLRFVALARSLGFSVEDCRTLLALWRDRGRSSAEVRRTLATLVASCHGDARPDRPIIEELAEGAEGTPS